MSDRCRTCRFWKLALKPDEIDHGEDHDAGFGTCRRHPPRIIEHMAAMTIDQPRFGGVNYDPEDVATPANVYDASLFPVTFGTDWCGEFEPVGGRQAPC